MLFIWCIVFYCFHSAYVETTTNLYKCLFLYMINLFSLCEDVKNTELPVHTDIRWCNFVYFWTILCPWMIRYIRNENLIPFNFILHFGVNLIFSVFCHMGSAENKQHLLRETLKSVKKSKGRNNVAEQYQCLQ